MLIESEIGPYPHENILFLKRGDHAHVTWNFVSSMGEYFLPKLFHALPVLMNINP